MHQVDVLSGANRRFASRLECHPRPGGSSRIDEVERGAEQPRKGVIQGHPSSKRPVSSQMCRCRAVAVCSLIIRVCFYPSPQFHPRTSLLRTAPWSCAPTLIVPSSGAEPQVQLLCFCMLQYLPQRPRYVFEMLLLVRLKRSVAPKIEGCK